MTEIGGGSFEEIDTTEWETCESGDHKIAPWPPCRHCGQRHPPKPSRLFKATHKVTTTGFPDAFHLRAADALRMAEGRWRDGHRSALWLHAPEGWVYWRSYPD